MFAKNTPTLNPNKHTHARLIVTLPAKANTFKKRGAIGLKKKYRFYQQLTFGQDTLYICSFIEKKVIQGLMKTG